MLQNRSLRIVAICAVLYFGYLGALLGLKLFYFGPFQSLSQVVLVWIALALVAVLDRKFELI